jgi:type VI secretion system secreted protein Hcp
MKTSQSGSSRKAIHVVLAAGVAVGASQAAVADDIFLNIPGMPGESTDSKHKGEIDVMSFSQSFEGRECPQVTLTKRFDKATPLLAEATSKGKAIPSATLVVRKSSYKDQQEYIKLTMSYVTVLRSDQYVSGESAQEDLTLGARSITISYRPVLETGALDKEVARTVMCAGAGRN